jgi:hypothetical protein
MIIDTNRPLLYIFDVKNYDLNAKRLKKGRGLVGCDKKKEEI